MPADAASHLRNRSSRMLWIVELVAMCMQLQRADAIVQGISDTGNTYSKVCSLVAVDGGGYDVVCSAVLISPSILLSAAHCAGLFQYVSCDSTVAGTPNLLNVSSSTQHPSFFGDEVRAQDLLLIKLVEGYSPSSGVAALPPLQLLDDLKEAGDFNADQVFTIVGYGGTLILTPGADDSGPDAPRNKNRYYTPADFMSLSIDRLQLSVSLARGVGGSVCRGDSGGPVFYAPTGVLVGIMSRADNLCSREAIANRLDTAPVRSWLALQGVQVP